jgi:lysozyme family protein
VFQKAVDIVIRLEGGDKLVSDPNDPGGLTKFGISKRAYPSTDIANLTRDQAEFLYKTDYWLPAGCDGYPWPLSLYVFDAAVNHGLDAAKKMLQDVAGVPQDGIVGPRTLKAIAAGKELDIKYLARRALRYFGTRNFDIYGKGWLNRLFRLQEAAR